MVKLIWMMDLAGRQTRSMPWNICWRSITIHHVLVLIRPQHRCAHRHLAFTILVPMKSRAFRLPEVAIGIIHPKWIGHLHWLSEWGKSNFKCMEVIFMMCYFKLLWQIWSNGKYKSVLQRTAMNKKRTRMCHGLCSWLSSRENPAKYKIERQEVCDYTHCKLNNILQWSFCKNL